MNHNRCSRRAFQGRGTKLFLEQQTTNQHKSTHIGKIAAHTYGAIMALAGRNAGLALDNQPSNFELSSRAKFSQRKINQ